ncbi:hypothetical protein [Citrobacter freundii]|uniref:hypothetical protein n=1 Tax=Citrobacter freundii TaxID=546 RepID=UPI0019020404|nr:hypothetical protein [Citrobacter freundii]MBJ8879280.1 hypothetical protein [Citrobacter freundii]MDE9637294.1 hypothetical protein [Citrobacter freundii]HAT3812748.1 hypothetical protein [Citrobacter freundii]
MTPPERHLCAKSGSSKTANGDDQTGAGQSRQNNTTYPDYSNKIKEIETNKGGVVIPAFIKFTSFLTDVRLAGSSNKAPSKRLPAFTRTENKLVHQTAFLPKESISGS